jgi:nucleotide-binding universal stress UspA family protein
MNAQKILITLSTEESLLPSLHHWGERFDWSHVGEVHFLHIVKKNVSPLEYGLIETPDEDSFEEMKPNLERYLKTEAQKIIPAEFKPKIVFHVSRDFYPDEETVSLLKKIEADLVVVAIHEKHSFFQKSFTTHMIKHAPCDVYVVRPQNHARSRAA